MLESQNHLERWRQPPEGLWELNPDVSTEELLSAEMALTYADLHAMIGNEESIARITPHTAIAKGRGIHP